MEIGEAVSALVLATGADSEEYCGGIAAEKHGWKARIDGYGATPTPEELCSNMKKAQIVPPAEPAKRSGDWDLEDCGKDRYPFQSHHLIPKKHLPKHNVCVWLTASWEKDRKFQLSEDTDFDTDHAKNGYFMPFVSSTYQWKHATSETTKTRLCFEMMERTGVQLHQGSHTAEDYGAEVEDIETGGYLTTIDNLLELVDGGALTHVETCDMCRGKNKGKKTLVQPLPAVVEQVYMVALLVKGLVDSNRIFVSARAAEYWKQDPA